MSKLCHVFDVVAKNAPYLSVLALAASFAVLAFITLISALIGALN